MKNVKIAVIGLGYVGLPLAMEFGKIYPTLGFDINEKRVLDLKLGLDWRKDMGADNFKSSIHLQFSSDPDQLRGYNVYIVAVPTPVNKNNHPDLTPLFDASKYIGKVLKRNDVVIYESTVYPGATEEDCVPVLEEYSGLVYNKDFYCGYSPERINPGDKVHTLTTICKITSGSTPKIADFVDRLYKSIITAGTYKASSIKVAEAAKVIENSQRDINIAFVNELAVIFNKLGIDTNEVLEAASTKWNFLSFKPGLVGGHCIGVDPYYLAHKALEVGYNPQILLAGRRLNDDMGLFIAFNVIKEMVKKGFRIPGSNILVMGITFKENCPDIRNSKVIGLIKELKEFGCNVEVYDPWANPIEVRERYDLKIIPYLNGNKYDAIVAAVAHDEIRKVDIKNLKNGHDSVVYDVKAIYPRHLVDGRL
ncbi:nucleotide sugar dehydrogenase [Labilibaculum sp. A4]|uniref:nucleotide sugar dehydrogenase n=1 Tax=Labilibaculum euxinus TaxID=2686357 RepID=UPI000F61E613|nr:nucleotide sugar dehydrogenase [Labilibaculum euxinus]MDQ1770353.1 nucleotide sugar dehydrogenase [Labilibaculum euxinus]MWN75428.1 nucleotide sugar dehydrogenase [Labilibaculum euxinus]